MAHYFLTQLTQEVSDKQKLMKIFSYLHQREAWVNEHTEQDFRINKQK